MSHIPREPVWQRMRREWQLLRECAAPKRRCMGHAQTSQTRRSAGHPWYCACTARGAGRTWKLPEQPALLIQTSMRPSCTAASSTSRCTLDGLATSHATPDTHTSGLTCRQLPCDPIIAGHLCTARHSSDVINKTPNCQTLVVLVMLPVPYSWLNRRSLSSFSWCSHHECKLSYETLISYKSAVSFLAPTLHKGGHLSAQLGDGAAHAHRCPRRDHHPVPRPGRCTIT